MSRIPPTLMRLAGGAGALLGRRVMLRSIGKEDPSWLHDWVNWRGYIVGVHATYTKEWNFPEYNVDVTVGDNFQDREIQTDFPLGYLVEAV